MSYLLKKYVIKMKTYLFSLKISIFAIDLSSLMVPTFLPLVLIEVSDVEDVPPVALFVRVQVEG